MEIAREKELKNIIYYLRSTNTNIFDAAVKASVATIELYQSKLELIVDDIIEFYDTELTLIDTMLINAVNAPGADQNGQANPEAQK